MSKISKTKFTAEELEAIADAILLDNGYDTNGQPLEPEATGAKIIKFKGRDKPKKEIPAVG